MKSRDDVIKCIECNLNFVQRSDCECCGYKCDKGMVLSVPINLLADALALLKAQEPKPPVIKENAYGWKFFYCPSCGREFYADRQHGCVNDAKFCDKCGQAVRWK